MRQRSSARPEGSCFTRKANGAIAGLTLEFAEEFAPEFRANAIEGSLTPISLGDRNTPFSFTMIQAWLDAGSLTRPNC